ncbi:MAG TPA: RNA polymerase sigma factor [Polyangia bacterium]|nr:RNA polymerase sigma factor [Polyangia bacterium]
MRLNPRSQPAPIDAEEAAAQDRDLVDRCLARDTAAWRALYDAHHVRVARLIAALGIVDGEADDVCQEIFVIIYRHLRTFRGEARLSTWIHRLATRHALRHAKRRRLRRAVMDMLTRAAPPRLPSDWGENAAARRQYLTRLLACLPPERRLALVLSEIEGRTAQEIAAQCGCSVATVWTRVHRARTQLEALAREAERGLDDGGRVGRSGRRGPREGSA